MPFISFSCLICIGYYFLNSVNDSGDTKNPCLYPNFNCNGYSVSSLSSFSMQDICQISLTLIGNKIIIFLF